MRTDSSHILKAETFSCLVYDDDHVIASHQYVHRKRLVTNEPPLRDTNIPITYTVDLEEN